MNIHSPSFIWLLLAITQAGCVAFNVPSQRYHDPDDHGGMLGPWSHQPASVQGGQSCLYQAHGCDVDDEINCDPLGVDSDGRPKPPEIPWPRFHPVPTRPVFGPAQL